MSSATKQSSARSSAATVKANLLPGVKPEKSAALRSQRKADIDMRHGRKATPAKRRQTSSRSSSAGSPKLIPVPKSGKSAAKANKSTKLLVDSVKGLSGLREFCKQCLGYVQQADTMLEQIQGTAKSLQEAGILQKLMESKGKNLNTSDMTTLLFALLNSPLGQGAMRKFQGSEPEKK